MRVPLAEEKKTGPACIIIFLGLEIDTLEMVIRIPQENLVEVRHKLHMVLNKKKITLKELVGLLNFCARAIPSVRKATEKTSIDLKSTLHSPILDYPHYRCTVLFLNWITIYFSQKNKSH
jgi:hypothetical protein